MCVTSRRHISDFVGFAFFAALAIVTFWRAPVVGLLLLPTLLHEALTAIAFLIRRPLLRQARSLGARVAAYGSTFVFVGFLQFSALARPQWVAPSSSAALRWAGILIWLVGAVLGIWTVFRLRHAFSVVPQARALVTAGPYRLARHPIYVAYLWQYCGILLGHATLPLALAAAAWAAATAWRVRYEEAVLAAAFPEYARYRAAVPRFGVGRRRTLPVQPEHAAVAAPTA